MMRIKSRVKNTYDLSWSDIMTEKFLNETILDDDFTDDKWWNGKETDEYWAECLRWTKTKTNYDTDVRYGYYVVV